MRIDHMAIYVKDLEGVKEFFIKFFNAKSNDKYHNPKTGLQTYFLTFEDGARLEIMTCPDMICSEKSIMQQGFIHLAFSIGSKEKVDKLTSELKENGYEVLSGPRTTGDGYYESCILGPEGNILEITE